MTIEQYLHTPEAVGPTELAYGVLRVAESPSVSHQRIVLNLSIALAAHVRERGLGEVIAAPMDVILDYEANLVVQPDLLFVSTERSSILADRVRGAPDLVVEVLSPSTRVGKLDEHLGWYARYGVRECWLASLPQRTIEVIGFTDGMVTRRTSFFYEEVLISEVLAGIGLKPVDVLGFY